MIRIYRGLHLTIPAKKFFCCYGRLVSSGIIRIVQWLSVDDIAELHHIAIGDTDIPTQLRPDIAVQVHLILPHLPPAQMMISGGPVRLSPIRQLYLSLVSYLHLILPEKGGIRTYFITVHDLFAIICHPASQGHAKINRFDGGILFQQKSSESCYGWFTGVFQFCIC